MTLAWAILLIKIIFSETILSDENVHALLIKLLVIHSSPLSTVKTLFLLGDKSTCQEALMSKFTMEEFGEATINKVYENLTNAIIKITPDIINDSSQVTIENFIQFKQSANSTYLFDHLDDYTDSRYPRASTIRGELSALGKTTPIEITLKIKLPAYPSLFAGLMDTNEYDVLGNVVVVNPEKCAISYNRGIHIFELLIVNANTGKEIGKSYGNDTYGFHFGEILENLLLVE